MPRIHKSRSKHDTEYEDEENLIQKRNQALRRHEELEAEIEALRQKIKNADESDSESKISRNKRNRSKHRDVNGDLDDNDIENRERTRKSDKHRKEDVSKERKGRKSRKEASQERELDLHNDSLNNEEDADLPSPREKIGLPIDLSWRHMTKAERRRLEMARQKLLDEEEK